MVSSRGNCQQRLTNFSEAMIPTWWVALCWFMCFNFVKKENFTLKCSECPEQWFCFKCNVLLPNRIAKQEVKINLKGVFYNHFYIKRYFTVQR